MKKFIQTLIMGLIMSFSFSSMAAQPQIEGTDYWMTKEACITAAQGNTAAEYRPEARNTPPSRYKKTTLAEEKYTNGACAQGFTLVSNSWVYLPSWFEVGKKGESLIMWLCSNPITEVVAVPVTTQVQRPSLAPSQPLQSHIQQIPSVMSSSAPLACKGEEECKQMNWCDTNGGWYPSKDAAGNSIHKCDVPGEMRVISKQNIVRIQEQTTILPEQLPTEVRPWKVAAPVVVPAAPAIRVEVQGSQGTQINMGRQQNGTVSGQSCSTQGCSSRPVANFVSEVKASFCGIRTSDGRLFKLGAAPDGTLIVADWTNGSEGRKMRIGGQAAGNDCDVAQAAVERTHWAGMTKYFGLPNGCAVTQRHAGQIAKN
jgi:hypothetical protein